MKTGKSGSFELSSRNWTVKVFWSEEYSIDTNQSVVSIDKVQMKSASYASITYYLDGSIKVEDSALVEFNSRSGTHYARPPALNTYVDVKASGSNPDAPWKSGRITHGADGSKSVTITVNIAGYTTSGDYGNGWKVSGSKNVTLTTIPRASTIQSAGDLVLGNKCSVKWTPMATSFYYKLVFALGDQTKTITGIVPKTTSAYTYSGFTIPLSWASEITAAKTDTVKVTLTTHTASSCTSANQVGSADSETFTVTVPDNSSTKPTVSMTLSTVSSLADTFDGLYIQGKTKVKAELSATGKYDATIKSYSMKADGVTYDADADYTSDYLANAGEITVYGYAKDSRGFTGSTSKKITVIGYSKPQILDVEAVRCDEDGNPTDSGTHLKIKAKRSYSKVTSGGVQKNFCKIRYRYKLESADSYSPWVTLLDGNSLDSDMVETGALLGGVLALSSTYLVQVGVVDDIGGSIHTTAAIPTDKVYMHRDKVRRALSFGMYIQEDNCIDIAEDIKLRVRGPFEVYTASTADELSGNTVDYLKLGAKIIATAAAPVSLNSFKTPGNYYSPNADNSQYITDSPYTEGGFALTVRELQNTSYIRQELFYARTTWIRHFDGTDWSGWWRYQTTTVAETAAADYVIETGVSGGWTYKKWKGGTYEMFGTFTVTPSDSTLNSSLYRTNNMTIAVPFKISSAYVTGTAVGHYWITNGGISGTNKITLRLMSDKTFSTTTAIEVRLHVAGVYA